MRLELALIVGILIFCSWCAYIVARMNSSVNVGPSAGAARASPASSLSQFAPSSGGGDLSRPANGSLQPTLIGHATMNEQQQSRLFGASEPIPSAQFTPQPPPGGLHTAGRNWPPYASSGGGGVDSTRGEGNYPAPTATVGGLQQWQSYALPSHAYAAGLPAPAYASQPLLLDYGGQQLAVPAAAEEQDAGQEGEDAEEAGPEDEGGVADYPQVAAASGEEPAEGEETEEGSDEEQEVEQPPPPQTELEEVANRRSFDELRSDSSERDKDGRVIVTKRRHLINGRPVAVNRPKQVVGRDDQGEGQTDDDHERTAASIRVPYSSSAVSAGPDAGGQSEADFEKLVDEIDEEDKLRKRAAAKPEVASQTAQSRQHGTKLRLPSGAPEPFGRRSDPDTPSLKPSTAPVRPAVIRAVPAKQHNGPRRSDKQKRNDKEKDTHEHSLQESLQAQQWDDDSATSGGGATIAPEAASELGDEEDQDEVSNIVESDQEARKLARMSRDFLLNPERVSRELDQEQERRRRRRRKRDTTIRSSVPSSARSLTSPSLPSLDNLPSSSVPVLAAVAKTRVQAAKDLSRGENIDTIGTERYNGTLVALTALKVARLPAAPSRVDEQQTAQLAHEEAPAGVAAASSVVVSPPWAESAAPQGNLEPLHKVDEAQKQVQLLSNLSSLSSPPPQLPAVVSNYLSNNNDTATTVDHSKQEEQEEEEEPSNDANDQRDKPSAGGGGGQMSGLEDMHVEVLADPPAASQPGHIWPPPALATSYGLAYPTAATTIGAPLSGHSHQSEPQLASGSHKVKKKKKKKVISAAKRKKKYKKANKSKMVDSKYKAARAYARKHSSRHKKGQVRKRKRKSEKELVAQKKHFKGSTRGNKFARGEGAYGAKKGGKFYKDKGYKKRGFKKSYHKLETGDHKTYFDEFRDKDHHKKWKNFDDRHKYLQKKKWAGSDAKHLDAHKLKLAKARASKTGQWRESAANKHSNEMDKYKKYKKSASKSKAIKSSDVKKRKKKVKKERK